MARWKLVVNYHIAGVRWPGFARGHHFAVRWAGRLRIYRSGPYWFGTVIDEGSKLWLGNRCTINYDCFHAWRNREAAKHPTFGQGGRCKNPNSRKSNIYFAVRWTGRLRIFRTGHHRFGVVSDDGSKLWINIRYTINRWVAWLAQLRGHRTSSCWVKCSSA